MCDHLDILAQNRKEDLTGALHQLDSFLAKHVLPPAQRYAVRLAFEELASNVIRHQTAPCAFSVAIDLSPLSMMFKDDGSVFNPLEHTVAPDIALPLEQRVAGKLGIHLLRSMVPSMTYERCGHENVIRLQFENGE